jgi:hypothetical protein
LASLPVRRVSATSAVLYRRTFKRMWAEPVLDALRPDDARGTYQLRRAALHYMSRAVLARLIDRLKDEARNGDTDRVQQAAGTLLAFIERLEPALALDPAARSRGSRSNPACRAGARRTSRAHAPAKGASGTCCGPSGGLAGAGLGRGTRELALPGSACRAHADALPP